MRYHRQGRVVGGVLFAIAALSIAALSSVGIVHSSAQAKEAQSYLDTARGYVAKGNYKAAEIELRNAAREAPQDAHVHGLLAQVYLKLGDFKVAEREARSARDLNGEEADYLLPLAEAMMRQGKYADVQLQIKPGDGPRELESKVRVILSMAAAGLHDRGKTEALLREAVSLDESAPGPKLALARLLLGSDAVEAEKLVDEVLAADPRSAEAIAIKGETQAKRGDIDGAIARFGEALAIDPNNLTAHLSRANINLSRADFAAVDKDLDPILTASPQNFGANYLRALEHFKKRDFAAADKILDRLSPNFSQMAEGLYVQAATKYALGQYGQANDAIAKYVARVPQNPNGARLAANIALRQKMPDIAVQYLTAYLAKSTPDPATLTLLGNAYVALKKPALAMEQYEKAATLAPENLSLKTMVAASEIDAGAGRKGLDELEKVFATDAGVTIAGPTLVLTDLRTGQADKAAEVAEKLVKANGESLLYQNLLGMARMEQRNYPAAEEIFKNLAAKNPDFAPAATNLAHTYVVAGRTDDAKKVYQDFLARKPNEVSILLGLSDLARDAKQWDEAIGYADKARTAAPADPAPGLKLLNLYVLRQDWPRAKALASDLTTQFPSNVDVFDTQGRMLVSSGDQAGAIIAYQHAYEIAPQSSPILARYLSLLAAAKKFPEERTVLQSRLDKDPANRQIKEQLIRIEAEIGGLDAGLAKAASFAKDDPGSPLYDIVSADLYERGGKRPEAVALLEKAAAARPSDDGVAVALSRLYGRAGDPGKAEAVLTGHLKDHPDDTLMRAALADFYIASKKFDPAIAEETRLLAERANDPAALNNLAWLYQQVGDLPKAREFAEKAAAVAPNSGAIADTLGWVLLAQGDTEKALSHLEAASAASPGNSEIRYHVAVALGKAGRPADARAVLEKLLSSGASFTSKEDAQKLLDELKRG
jgi:putative PEP-CTERM system TPR-repeat lipoprotein